MNSVSQPSVSQSRQQQSSALMNGDVSDSSSSRGRYPDGDTASLDSIPQTELLDVSASKGRAHLASSGALGQRRPPSKSNSMVSSILT